jgi:hypothetical protein
MIRMIKIRDAAARGLLKVLYLEEVLFQPTLKETMSQVLMLLVNKIDYLNYNQFNLR